MRYFQHKKICSQGLSVALLILWSQYVFAMDTKITNILTNQTTFTIQLPSNPTTGFQWSLIRYDRDLFQVQQHYDAPKTKLIGAGGRIHFDFRLKPGQHYPKQSILIFQSARSWDIKHGMKTKMILNFVAAKNAA